MLVCMYLGNVVSAACRLTPQSVWRNHLFTLLYTHDNAPTNILPVSLASEHWQSACDDAAADDGENRSVRRVLDNNMNDAERHSESYISIYI